MPTKKKAQTIVKAANVFQPSSDVDRYVFETSQAYEFLSLHEHNGVQWQVTAITMTKKGYVVEFTRKAQ